LFGLMVCYVLQIMPLLFMLLQMAFTASKLSARSNRHIEPKADKTPMMLKTANFLIRFLNQTP
jgi:hypothetical protein